MQNINDSIFPSFINFQIFFPYKHRFKHIFVIADRYLTTQAIPCQNIFFKMILKFFYLRENAGGAEIFENRRSYVVVK